MCDECKISNDSIVYIKRLNRLSQALVHFVIDRASLFTNHKKNQDAQSVPSTSISEQFESTHTCDNSPTDFISSS